MRLQIDNGVLMIPANEYFELRIVYQLLSRICGRDLKPVSDIYAAIVNATSRCAASDRAVCIVSLRAAVVHPRGRA